MAAPSIRLSLAGPAALALAALAVVRPAALAGQPSLTGEPDVLQVVADIVLIETECRAYNVDYGRLFAFARANGLRPVDFMPLGAKRAAFDAAYRRRARETRGERLCGDLAAEREATIPGILMPR